MWLRGPGPAALLFGDRLTSLTRSLRVSNARFRATTGWRHAIPAPGKAGWPPRQRSTTAKPRHDCTPTTVEGTRWWHRCIRRHRPRRPPPGATRGWWADLARRLGRAGWRSRPARRDERRTRPVAVPRPRTASRCSPPPRTRPWRRQLFQQRPQPRPGRRRDPTPACLATVAVDPVKVIWARCTSNPPMMAIRDSFALRPRATSTIITCLSRGVPAHVIFCSDPPVEGATARSSLVGRWKLSDTKRPARLPPVCVPSV